MHGQKKRRKRSLDGVVVIEGASLLWELLSEPQWTTEDGYKGMRVSVQAEDRRHRELLLEYPMPQKTTSNGSHNYLHGLDSRRRQLRMASALPFRRAGTPALAGSRSPFGCATFDSAYAATPSVFVHGVATDNARFTASIFATPSFCSQSSSAFTPLLP
jgi:hypothetical protein